MRGAFDRLRAEGERDFALAHTVAILSRTARLQRLDHYLTPRKPVSSGKRMIDQLRSIAKRTGGTA